MRPASPRRARRAVRTTQASRAPARHRRASPRAGTPRPSSAEDRRMPTPARGNPRPVRRVSHSRPSRTSTAASRPSTNGLSPPPSSAPASEACPVRRSTPAVEAPRRLERCRDRALADLIPDPAPPASVTRRSVARSAIESGGGEFVRRLHGRVAGQRRRPVGHLRGDIQPARLERELCFGRHGHAATTRCTALAVIRTVASRARHGTVEPAFHGSALDAERLAWRRETPVRARRHRDDGIGERSVPRARERDRAAGLQRRRRPHSPSAVPRRAVSNGCGVPDLRGERARRRVRVELDGGASLDAIARPRRGP